MPGLGTKSKRTFEDVFYRLKHDGATFDTAQVTIGYHDRIRGPMECPFSAFVPIRDGGDMPFHRLQYFRHATRGVLFVRGGIDCIFQSTRPSGVEEGFGITEDEEMLSLIKIAQRNREIVAYNNKQRALRKKKRHNSGSTRDVDSSRHQAFREGFFVEEEVERPTMTEMPVFRFVDGKWNIVDGSYDIAELDLGNVEKPLKVVSWNVLMAAFDDRDGGRSGVSSVGSSSSSSSNSKAPKTVASDATLQRWRNLLAAVRREDPDVITLQECDALFLEEVLLADPWIRQTFDASAAPGNLSSLEPYGQVLLSRPRAVRLARLRRCDFSPSKRVVIGEIHTCARGGASPPHRSDFRRLLVPCVHLTSDFRGSRVSQRDRQVAALLECCRLWTDDDDDDDDDGTSRGGGGGGGSGGSSGIEGPLAVLLVGDMNCADEHEDTNEWKSLSAFQFKTSGFPASSSATEILDVWRSLRPGEEGYTYDPINNPLALLHSPLGDDGQPKPQKRCDRMFLLQLKQPASAAESGGAEAIWAPLSIHLLGNDRQLVARGEGAEESSAGDLSDHYGLSMQMELRRQVKAGGTRKAKAASSSPPPGTAASAIDEFIVDGGGSAEEAFRRGADRIIKAVRVAASTAASGSSGGDRRSGRAAVIELGASSLGVALPTSDVDLLVIGDDPSVNNFLGRLSSALSAPGAFADAASSKSRSSPPLVRHARAKYVSVLKVSRIPGAPDLDVQYVCCPGMLDDLLNDKKNSDAASQLSLTAAGKWLRSENAAAQLAAPLSLELEGILDTVILLSANRQRSHLFFRITRLVKLWANQKGVYGTSAGFPGGFAWAVLVGAFLQARFESRRENKKQKYDDGFSHLQILHEFFDHFARFPWEQSAVEIASPQSAGATGDRSNGAMTVLTPACARNACRSATAETVETLRRELNKAALCAAAAQLKDKHRGTEAPRHWRALFSSGQQEFMESSEWFICVEVSIDLAETDSPSSNALAMSEAKSWLQLSSVPLVVALRRQSEVRDLRLWPVPFKLSTVAPAPAVCKDREHFLQRSAFATADSDGAQRTIGAVLLVAVSTSAAPSCAGVAAAAAAVAAAEGDGIERALNSAIMEPFQTSSLKGSNVQCRSGLAHVDSLCFRRNEARRRPYSANF
jgi:endonuclease/exonuclease/phosphatase family metal-dependent hydrolase